MGKGGEGGRSVIDSEEHRTYLVIKIPDRDAHAPIDLQAGVDDAYVVGGLLLCLGVGRGQGLVADVDLGIGNFDALGDELLEDRSKIGGVGGVSHDEMALETNTIDPHAGSLNKVDNSQGSRGLGARVLDVVVVVVEFHVSIGSGRRSEGNGDVVFADGFVEDVVPVRSIAVVAQRLVHDIPGVALALIVRHLVGNVGLQDLNERLVRPGVRGYP